MIFKRLNVQNFMSYQAQEFTGFDKPGLILIEGRNLDEGGSNGAGKSAIWDGISWVLFGQTVREAKADEVIHRKIGKDCGVEVDFLVGEDEFHVGRYRKHKIHKTKLVLKKNGKDLTGGTDTITQQTLIDEIGIDFELFRCTVVFAQEETFNFADGTNKEQKEILSKIMRVSFEEHHERSKRSITELNSKVQFHERAIDGLKIKIEASSIGDLEKDSEAWNTENNTRLKTQKNDLEKVEKRLGELKLVDGKPFEELKIKLADKISGLLKSEGEVKDGRSYHVGRVSIYEKEHGRLNALEGKCPTCMQDIDIRLAEKEAYGQLALLKIEQDGIQSADMVLEEVAKAVEEAQKKAEKLKSRMDENDAVRVEAEDLVVDQDRIQKDIDTISAEVNPWTNRIEEVKKSIDGYQKELKENESQLEVIGAEIPYHEFWVEAFGDNGIKSFIFDLICSTLTERANHYADILTGGSVVISFDTQSKTKAGEVREKFDCEIVRNGERVNYRTYSGGEKTRISLSVDMSLADVMRDYYKSEINIVVYDEQDQYLDNEGRKFYMDLLREKAKDHCVFVVAHDDQFKAMFDESWIIEKKDEVSKLVS